jgi:hypothetical protein
MKNTKSQFFAAVFFLSSANIALAQDPPQDPPLLPPDLPPIDFNNTFPAQGNVGIGTTTPG